MTRGLSGSPLDVFRRLLPGPSWRPWQLAIRAVFSLTAGLSSADRAFIRERTGGRPLPTSPAREAWFIVGRRGGKSRSAALVAVYLACFRRYTLAPGERGVLMVIAADRRQARVVKGYISGMLRASPALSALVEQETRESIVLRNHVTIEIHAASFKTVRGYSVVGAVLDEVAFWPTEDSANPDSEIIAALRPAMATIPGALLVVLSTPYARRGELWRVHQQHYGQAGDVLVWQAPTRTMNPTVPASVVEQAEADDPAVAAAEYGAAFRADIESFVSREALAAVVIKGRFELPPQKGVTYAAFTDPAGGSGSDSFTLGISHGDGDRAVLDAVREIRPPFSPSTVVEEFAALLKTYHIDRVTGDCYAGEWPREAFRKHGITYAISEQTKSDLYRELLPMVNAGRIELLDHVRLIAQLGSLERRTARGGRDSIDHAPNGHDDISNAAAGALVLTRVSLGKSALPDAFIACARELSYSWDHRGCYLFNGPSPGDDPDLCPSCPGNKAARAQHRRYIEAGGEQDLRSWAKDNVRLPDALAWAELRAWAKSNPCL